MLPNGGGKMYVGAIFYDFKADRVDSAVEAWEEHVIPSAKKMEGFIKAELFIDPKTGKGLDIGYWHSKEDAIRFRENGLFDLLVKEMTPYLKEEPSRQMYKVMVSDLL